MNKLVKINNLTSLPNIAAATYINPNHIAYINERNSGEVYAITTVNNSIINTDKESFDRIMGVIKND